MLKLKFSNENFSINIPWGLCNIVVWGWIQDILVDESDHAGAPPSAASASAPVESRGGKLCVN